MFEKTVKSFAINFNSYNERGTFESGDLITGQLSFELTKEAKISYITMEVVGKAEVHWSTSSGSGKNRSRRHYSATLEFFKLKSTIMEVNGGTLSGAFALSQQWGKPHTSSLYLSLSFLLSCHRINKTSARYSRVPLLVPASARVRMSLTLQLACTPFKRSLSRTRERSDDVIAISPPPSRQVTTCKGHRLSGSGEGSRGTLGRCFLPPCISQFVSGRRTSPPVWNLSKKNSSVIHFYFGNLCSAYMQSFFFATK